MIGYVLMSELADDNNAIAGNETAIDDNFKRENKSFSS